MRTIRDGEPRTATLTFTQLLNSEKKKEKKKEKKEKKEKEKKKRRRKKEEKKRGQPAGEWAPDKDQGQIMPPWTVETRTEDLLAECSAPGDVPIGADVTSSLWSFRADEWTVTRVLSWGSAVSVPA